MLDALLDDMHVVACQAEKLSCASKRSIGLGVCDRGCPECDAFRDRHNAYVRERQRKLRERKSA